MKKAMLIVLAILVMATIVVAQDSTAPPTPKVSGTTTWLNVDGDQGHISHGCMLCHAPHSANANISSAPVQPITGFGATGPVYGPLAPGNYPPGYTGPTGITSIVTGFSGGAVAGSIYLWGTALTNQTYTTWEGSSISKGNIVNKNSAVVHTLLCMSCHDNANSNYLMGMGFGQGPGTEYGTGNAVTDGYNDHIGISTINSCGTGWGSTTTPACTAANSSLQNSHPVDVAYTSGGYNWLINPDGTFQDTSFNLDGTHLGHPAKLWVDGATNVAMVECTSCHDPHRETAFAYWNGGTVNAYVGPGTANDTTIFYLRGPYTNPESGNGNINANFCRSCHYSKSELYANSGGAAH